MTHPIDTTPEAIAALRENARNAGKEGAGMHRNAGDAGRVAALWIEEKGGNARAADPISATIARLTAERDEARAQVVRWQADANLMLGFAQLAYKAGAKPSS